MALRSANFISSANSKMSKSLAVNTMFCFLTSSLVSIAPSFFSASIGTSLVSCFWLFLLHFSLPVFCSHSPVSFFSPPLLIIIYLSLSLLLFSLHSSSLHVLTPPVLFPHHLISKGAGGGEKEQVECPRHS